MSCFTSLLYQILNCNSAGENLTKSNNNELINIDNNIYRQLIFTFLTTAEVAIFCCVNKINNYNRCILFRPIPIKFNNYNELFYFKTPFKTNVNKFIYNKLLVVNLVYTNSKVTKICFKKDDLYQMTDENDDFNLMIELFNFGFKDNNYIFLNEILEKVQHFPHFLIQTPVDGDMRYASRVQDDYYHEIYYRFYNNIADVIKKSVKCGNYKMLNFILSYKDLRNNRMFAPNSIEAICIQYAYMSEYYNIVDLLVQKMRFDSLTDIINDICYFLDANCLNFLLKTCYKYQKVILSDTNLNHFKEIIIKDGREDQYKSDYNDIRNKNKIYKTKCYKIIDKYLAKNLTKNLTKTIKNNNFDSWCAKRQTDII